MGPLNRTVMRAIRINGKRHANRALGGC